MCKKICENCIHWDNETKLSVTSIPKRIGRCDELETELAMDIHTKPAGVPAEVSYIYTRAWFSCGNFDSRLYEITEENLRNWNKTLWETTDTLRAFFKNNLGESRKLGEELLKPLYSLRNEIMKKIK